MARSAASAPKEPASYEQALAELDRLVSQMEGGQLPLDQLLDGYRRGAELLAYCRARLQAVEQKVQVLDEGQLKAWSPT
jgi:exodeoxyribonuclease VII small subunit